MYRNYAGCKYTFVLTFNIPLSLVLMEMANYGFMIQITGKHLLLFVPIRALLLASARSSFSSFVSKEREAIQVPLQASLIINMHEGH